MPKQEYDWTDGSPAILAPHSLAKHTILREYIERYIQILTRNGQIPDFSIVLIDGFAGGGEYILQGQGSVIHEGSPVVLINAVQAATVKINQDRQKPIEIDARFIFVEKKRSNFAYLSNNLERRFGRKMIGERIRLIQGAFEEHIDQIILDIKSSKGRKPRPIFILDQYGYSAVPVSMLTKIMTELPNSEIFFTIAIDWIGAYSQSLQGTITQLQKSLHISSQTIDFLHGHREIEELSAIPEENKTEIMLAIQKILHDAFALQSGAKFYTPFFITSRNSNRSYWFLHLANNARANDAVKNLHWKVSNHFRHYGHAGTQMLMLGFDPKNTQLSFDFDDSAESNTINALLHELPELIRQKYPDGISFKDLYANICNETPASKELLGKSVNTLCIEGELEKSGAEGERRRLQTLSKDGDIIRIPTQGRLFPLPFRKRKQ